MVIVNPFDLLGLGEEEENYDNDEVLFREAEKKALEDAKVNAAAKEIAKFASLRAAAEKEDRDRTEAKNREERERRKAAFLDRKKKEKEEEEKKLKEQSASDTTSVSSDIVVENKKVKVRKPTIKVFPGDCEKPRLPPLLPRKKYVEPPIVHVYGTTGASYDRPSSRHDRASCYEDGNVTENYEQKSDVESYGQNAYENGNAGYGNYERPLSRNRSRRYRIADAPAGSVNGRRDEEPVPTPETEGNALPEESLEKCDAIIPDNNKVQVNVEKNEPAVSDTDKEKKEELKMTLREYLQGLEEQRKKVPAKATEERKVQIDSELKKMKQLSLKKGEEEIFIKLGSNKDGGNRKKASIASGKDAKEKSISSTAFFRYQKYQRPQPQPRPFTEGDGGETTNGNQGKGREQGDKGLPAAAPYNGSQGCGNSQQHTGPQKAPYRGNPPAARGDYGGQSRWSGGPYEGNQRRGRDGYPQSNGDARAETLDIKKDFPPLKTE